MFFFRSGCNFGNRSFFPTQTQDQTTEDILAAFLGQFYDDKTPPREVLLSHPLAPADDRLLAEALSLKAGRKVTLGYAKRGDRRKMMEHAYDNAREALGRRMAESSAQVKLLDGLAQLLGLDGRPDRVEVYDNSHIQGSNAVGGMIVAGPDGFNKNEYRKFNIRSEDLSPGDDFGMMREVLTRRFRRVQKEDPDRERGQWPDLVLIDGGPGQLKVAIEVLTELGIEDVTLTAISKGPDRNAGRERFHLPDRPPFSLPPNDPVLYFLQRLRDEAHRFAIGTHRARRSKAITGSPARRNRRNRRQPEKGVAEPFRFGPRRLRGRPDRSAGRRRHQRDHGEKNLQPLSSRRMTLERKSEAISKKPLLTLEFMWFSGQRLRICVIASSRSVITMRAE